MPVDGLEGSQNVKAFAQNELEDPEWSKACQNHNTVLHKSYVVI